MTTMPVMGTLAPLIGKENPTLEEARIVIKVGE